MAAAAAAAVGGAVLGLAGSVLAEPTRAVLATIAALALLVLAVLRLGGHGVAMWQRDCETAQSWLERGPVAWALLNGAALGLGFTSRIGFLLWYTIPVSAFAFGDPAAGAAIYGAYGASRGFLVWAWFAVIRLSGKREVELSEWLFARDRLTKRLDAGLLAVAAIVTLALAGF